MKWRDAAFDRALDQRAALHRVVLIIFERVLDRFGHHHRAGEMHDRADPVLGDQPRDQAGVGDVALGEGRAVRHRPVEAGGRDCRSPPPASRRRAGRARRGCRYSRRRPSPAPAILRVRHPVSHAVRCSKNAAKLVTRPIQSRSPGRGQNEVGHEQIRICACGALFASPAARRLRDGHGRRHLAGGVGHPLPSRPADRARPDRGRAGRPGRRQQPRIRPDRALGRARARPAGLDGRARATAAPSRSPWSASTRPRARAGAAAASASASASAAAASAGAAASASASAAPSRSAATGPDRWSRPSSSVRIQRRSDATVAWEGRAEMRGARRQRRRRAAAAAADRLAAALFRDFPGESGRTIRVR